ncbi:MAG: DMT family transporter [Silicimonas sp.]|nr:DMT family transporter [Silicimonas sp.]
MTLSRPLTGHLAMLAFSALVSFSFTFGNMVAGEIDPGLLTALRFLIAAAVLLGLARFRRTNLAAMIRGFWRWGVIGGLMAAYFITMFEALRLTTALATAAVFTLTPLMAAGFGRLLLGTRSGARVIGALILGGIGALWVIFRADLAALLAFDIGPGERLFVLGALAHAAVPATTRRLAPEATAFEAALGTTFGALLVTAIYAAPEALAADFTALSAAVWAVAFYLGVVTTAGTFFLLQVAIARIPPAKVMAYTYLVPSWVVLHGLALGQNVPLSLALGIALTLAALAILLMQDMRRA